MMGGLCLLLNGNMIGGVDRTKDGAGRFMFRVGKENEAKALARPGASAVEMGGRRFGGFVFVDAQACTSRALTAWVEMGLREGASEEVTRLLQSTIGNLRGGHHGGFYRKLLVRRHSFREHG